MEAEDPNNSKLARGVELVLLIPSVWRRRSAMRARNSGSMGFRVPLRRDFKAIAIALDEICPTILPAMACKLGDYPMNKQKRRSTSGNRYNVQPLKKHSAVRRDLPHRDLPHRDNVTPRVRELRTKYHQNTTWAYSVALRWKLCCSLLSFA